MKTFHIQLISVVLCVFALALHQSFTLADDYEEEDIEIVPVSTLRSLDELSPEEEALANEARAHIAKTIEDNLVRLLAIASARSDRRPRQEDEDDDSVTPNPNVLPQVAQILGAIFSGSLNISRVVDQTIGLVPNIVRNQVGGIVKLLTTTGDAESSTNKNAAVPTTAASKPAAESVTVLPTTPTPTEAPTTKAANEAVIVEAVKTEPPTTTKAPEPEPEVTIGSVPDTTTVKGKYRVRNRTKGPTTTTRRPLEDDEIQKLEDEIIRAGRAYEPLMQDAQPDYLASVFKNVIQRIDFNMTEITRAVPSIFKGTRQAFTVLENLGILDVNDVLDELDLPALEEEEEEEEE